MSTGTNTVAGVSSSYKGFSLATPNNQCSRVLFKCGDDEYTSTNVFVVSTSLEKIVDEYSTRVENDTGFNMLRNSDMKFITFTKIKSQIEYIRDELNKIFDQFGVNDSKYHAIVKNIIGISGLSKDEIFEKLRKFPNSAKALVVLFKYDAISGIEVSLGDGIHVKEIFQLLLNTANDPNGLTRKAIRYCWTKMTSDEKVNVQQQMKDLIISCATGLATKGDDDIISNIRFLNEFILEAPKK
jgi:hypothetical protein